MPVLPFRVQQPIATTGAGVQPRLAQFRGDGRLRHAPFGETLTTVSAPFERSNERLRAHAERTRRRIRFRRRLDALGYVREVVVRGDSVHDGARFSKKEAIDSCASGIWLAAAATSVAWAEAADWRG